MLQAIRSASGLIAVVFVFIAAGSEGTAETLIALVVAFLFGWIELEEAREMGFLNPPQSRGAEKVSLQNQRVSPKSLKL